MLADVVGILEYADTATGHHSLDALVKAAPVRVLRVVTVNPGKMIVIVTGDVASVEAALARGRESAGSGLVDSLFLPYAHERVAEALLRTAGSVAQRPLHASIGMVESATVASGVAAADIAAKAVEISLLEIRFDDAMGGRASIRFSAELDAVETAVDVASDHLRASKRFIRATVIANPHPEMVATLDGEGEGR